MYSWAALHKIIISLTARKYFSFLEQHEIIFLLFSYACHRPLAEAKKEERKYMCLDKENKLWDLKDYTSIMCIQCVPTCWIGVGSFVGSTIFLWGTSDSAYRRIFWSYGGVPYTTWRICQRGGSFIYPQDRKSRDPQDKKIQDRSVCKQAVRPYLH